MNPEDIKQHWTDCARQHGTDLAATTLASTIKQLEIDALWRRMKDLPAGTEVLEAGCGNGVNLIELAKRLPELEFDGFDYVPEMVNAAREAKYAAPIAHGKIYFWHADILKEPLPELGPFDVVFTDRCIINLDTWEKQKQAIKTLADKVRPGGQLLMIENVTRGRELQSTMLEHLGYEGRGWPPFNLFLDENEVCEYLGYLGMEPEGPPEYFGSLHDLCLYVLGPSINGGVRDYGHPLVKIATELSLKMPGADFGRFGQNVLFACRKPR